MLTERDLANDGVEIVENPAASNFRTVANKPASAPANADAKWVAASNPQLAAASSRIARVDAVALSAATTVEGHEILKKEIEKVMKSTTTARQTAQPAKVKKARKAAKAESNITL